MSDVEKPARADEHEKFAQAKERMEEITGFCVHLVAFAVFMVLMLVVDILDGDELTIPLDWVFWPFFGWGFGILCHAFVVYGHIPTPRVIADWQERKTEELKAKM